MKDQDPVNVAVFKYRQLDKILIAESASFTSKDEAVALGLNSLEEIRKASSHPIELLEIYSEWKPSGEILRLISERYPNVECSFSFHTGDEEKFRNQMNKLNNQENKRWWQFWK